MSIRSLAAAAERAAAISAGVALPSPAAAADGRARVPAASSAWRRASATSPAPAPMSGPCASPPRSTRTAAGVIAAGSAPVASATRRISAENSMVFRNAISRGASVGVSLRSASEAVSGTSSFNRTSSREIRALSAWSTIDWRRLSCLISPARANSVSRSPNWPKSCAAVFGPMPGTPGTLSTESPVSACRSIILSGVTPHFSTTSGTPIWRSFIGSYIDTCGPTSCIRSLSEEMMVTPPPASLDSRQ